MEQKNQPQKLFYYAISMAMIIVSISVSYYFLVILPEQKNRKIEISEAELKLKEDAEERQIEAENKKLQEEREKAEQEELAKNIKEENKKKCIQNASSQYSRSWDQACTVWKKEVDKSWNNCMNSLLYFETPEARKTYCKNNTPDYSKDDNWACLLPTTYSEKIETNLKNSKEDCNKL